MITLREVRKMRGLTQKELAKLLGVKSAASIVNYERGKSLPRPEVMQRLKDIFGGLITYDTLLTKPSKTKE